MAADISRSAAGLSEEQPACRIRDSSVALRVVLSQALAYIYDKDIVKSLFEQAPKRYGERNGGYCRVVTETRVRRGDSAEMAIIELV